MCTALLRPLSSLNIPVLNKVKPLAEAFLHVYSLGLRGLKFLLLNQGRPLVKGLSTLAAFKTFLHCELSGAE